MTVPSALRAARLFCPQKRRPILSPRFAMHTTLLVCGLLLAGVIAAASSNVGSTESAAETGAGHHDSFATMRQLLSNMAAGLPLDASAADRLKAGAANRRHLSASSAIPALVQIPSGLRSLLRNQVLPSSSMQRIFAPQPAAPSQATTNSNLTNVLSEYRTGGSSSNLTADQAAIDSAILAVLSGVFNSVSGILYTVAGGVSTLQSALGVFLADYARQTSRIQFFDSAYGEGQTFYNDFNAQVDGSDYLGDAAKYIKLWNQLKTELNSGEMQSDASYQLSQMATVQALLQKVVDASTAVTG